jgi:AraC family ethanolamine operon transcriptional activator
VLNPEFWERPPQGIVPLTSRRPKEFKEIADLWLNAALATTCSGGTADTSGLRSQLLHSVLQIAAVSDDGQAPSVTDRSRSLMIGRKARAFVEDRADSDEPPTVVDICEALGVSERTLQYAFREYAGMSPVSYLRICRLNRVRAALTASDPKETTITKVAMRFGFLHLGRFSGDYKRLFGETPSETLAS